MPAWSAVESARLGCAAGGPPRRYRGWNHRARDVSPWPTGLGMNIRPPLLDESYVDEAGSRRGGLSSTELTAGSRAA
jgi:hypothetical protein